MTLQDGLLLISAIICMAAMQFGSAPERLLSTALFADFVLEEACAVVLGREFAIEYNGMYCTLEFALLVFVCAVAVRANRVYPLWLGGAQIIAVSAHVLLQVLGPDALSACDAIDTVASAMVMIGLVAGLVSHARRKQRLGRAYPDWTRTTGSH